MSLHRRPPFSFSKKKKKKKGLFIYWTSCTKFTQLAHKLENLGGTCTVKLDSNLNLN